MGDHLGNPLPPVTCVAPVGDQCGEGAVWSAEERALYWTDVNRFLVHRWDADSDAVRFWRFDEPVVALSLTDRAGVMLVALGSRLLLWRPETDARGDHGFRLPGWPRVRLNEGCADPAGRFWVGTMKNNVLPNGDDGATAPGEGVLYRVASDGGASEHAHGIGISNTLCWSPDRRRLYFGDTMANVIRVWDYDLATGDIANPRPFLADYPRGGPDGSAMDSAGRLWNCRYGGGCVVRVAPDGGIEGTVELPVPNITTCAFGGPDLRTLFITTARGPRVPGDRLAGGLFSVPVDVPGQAENRVAL